MGNRGGYLALYPSSAAAASALRIRPTKTEFVAVTAAAIRCHQEAENQVVDQTRGFPISNPELFHFSRGCSKWRAVLTSPEEHRGGALQ